MVKNKNLLGALIGLARATEGNEYMMSEWTDEVAIEGLSVLAKTGEPDPTDQARLTQIRDQVLAEKNRLVPNCAGCPTPCGRTSDYDIADWDQASEEIIEAKLQILEAITELASALRAASKSLSASSGTSLQAKASELQATSLLYKALYSLGRSDWEAEALRQIASEAKDLIKM